MFRFFKCKHEISKLVVKREHSVEKIDDHFSKVTYHLYCIGCGEELNIVHASVDVDAFIAHGQIVSDRNAPL